TRSLYARRSIAGPQPGYNRRSRRDRESTGPQKKVGPVIAGLLTGTAGEIREAINACRTHFLFAAICTSFVNLLLLSYPLFMMQVYGRVLESRSIETLFALGMGMILALSFRTLFHWLSGRLSVRASMRIDRLLSDRVLSAMLERNAAHPGEVGSQLL